MWHLLNFVFVSTVAIRISELKILINLYKFYFRLWRIVNEFFFLSQVTASNAALLGSGLVEGLLLLNSPTAAWQAFKAIRTKQLEHTTGLLFRTDTEEDGALGYIRSSWPEVVNFNGTAQNEDNPYNYLFGTKLCFSNFTYSGLNEKIKRNKMRFKMMKNKLISCNSNAFIL